MGESEDTGSGEEEEGNMGHGVGWCIGERRLAHQAVRYSNHTDFEKDAEKSEPQRFSATLEVYPSRYLLRCHL